MESFGLGSLPSINLETVSWMQPGLGKKTKIAWSHQKMLDAPDHIKGYHRIKPTSHGENAAPQLMDLQMKL